MLVPASALAYWMVTALRSVFDGVYAPLTGPRSMPGVVCRVREATWLDWLTIRGDAERRSSGSIALITRMTPITLVSTAARMVSALSVVGSCGQPPVMPALLTSTSSRPARSSISWAAPVTLASSDTSRGTPNASTPAAISYPIPLLAPVTSAIFCSSMYLIMADYQQQTNTVWVTQQYPAGIDRAEGSLAPWRRESCDISSSSLRSCTSAGPPSAWE